MRCLACDAENADHARFCTSCGYALAQATQPQWAVSLRTWTQPQQAPNPAATHGPYGAFGATAAINAQPVYAPFPPAQPVYAPFPPGVQVVNNITVAPAPAAPPVVVVQNQDSGPNMLVRVLWFLFLGLWLGAISTTLGWLLIVSIIGLPLGLLIINRLPQIMTLKPTPSHLQVTVQNGVVFVQQGKVQQQPFMLRALYFVLVGWWVSFLWLSIAWALIGVTLGLGLPLAFWMFNRVPAVTTLAR